jgi:hypothetical protein
MSSNQSINCAFCEAKYNEENKSITRNGVSFCEKCADCLPVLKTDSPASTKTPLAPATMDDQYYFHQTPRECAADLIPFIPLVAGDRVLEPFKGEGAFYDQLPDHVEKDWCEITQGRDYKDYDKEYDWVVSNPPFKMDGKNVIWPMVDYYTDRAKKGVAFLVSDYGFTTLTPIRQHALKNKGWGLTKMTMVNIKKWRGRYFLLIFEKDKPSVMSHLLKNY